MSPEIILDELSARKFLGVLWNITIGNNLMNLNEFNRLETYFNEIGLTTKPLENPLPLNDLLKSIDDINNVGKALYHVAFNSAKQAPTLYQEEMLKIIKDHYHISDLEADSLTNETFSFSIKKDTNLENRNEGGENRKLKKALTALKDAGRLSIDGVEHFAVKQAKSFKTIADNILVIKYRKMFIKAAADTWVHVKEAPDVAVERYKKLDKSKKVMAISAMAGGAVVSIPFIIAMGPVSIVGALVTLGLGSLAVGGYGVAGGIVVTAGGAALSATLAGLMANKMIKDPEVEQLIENYKRLEQIIRENFVVMERHQQDFRQLYIRYGEIAKFMSALEEKIGKDEKYDLKQIREEDYYIKFLIDDFNYEIDKKG